MNQLNKKTSNEPKEAEFDLSYKQSDSLENLDKSITKWQKKPASSSPEPPVSLGAPRLSTPGKKKGAVETISSVAGISGFIKRFSISKLAAAIGSAFGGPIGAAIASAIARVLVGTFNAINRFVGLKVGGIQGFLISLALWFATITMVILIGVFTVLIIPLLVGSFTLIFLLSFIIFVINAALVLLVATVVPGFQVTSFWWALIFSLILSLVNSFFKHQKKD